MFELLFLPDQATVILPFKEQIDVSSELYFSVAMTIQLLPTTPTSRTNKYIFKY